MTTLFWENKFPLKSQVFFLLWGKNNWSKKQQTFWTLIWRSFFLENDLKKKKGEAKNKATMNIDPPPTTNNYERRTRHISRRKFDVTNNPNGNLKQRIMQEAGKQRCNMVPQSLNSNGEGCRSPVQWPSCFIAMFWLFEFAKISMQNVRKTKANFASNRRSSKQIQTFVFYKHFTALSSSNRRPRIF